MAFPKLLQRLFENQGKGPKLNRELFPEDIGGAGLTEGSAIFFSGKNPPSTLTPANGALHDGSAHPAALEQFGDTYGGDGVFTFGVPDMRTEPPFTGGQWMSVIGEDHRLATRFYCGRGLYCGQPGLYPGATINP